MQQNLHRDKEFPATERLSRGAIATIEVLSEVTAESASKSSKQQHVDKFQLHPGTDPPP